MNRSTTTNKYLFKETTTNKQIRVIVDTKSDENSDVNEKFKNAARFMDVCTLWDTF